MDSSWKTEFPPQPFDEYPVILTVDAASGSKATVDATAGSETGVGGAANGVKFKSVNPAF